jgi:hypothetical protein
MKTTPFRLSLLALSLATAFIFMACNRRDKDKDSDTSLAADHALSENVYHDAVNIADEASDLLATTSVITKPLATVLQLHTIPSVPPRVLPLILGL